MLTSKQRAQLKSIAASQQTIIQIGKSGITDSVAAQMNTALDAHEIVKGRVLDNSLLSAQEACTALAQLCNAEPVQFIGTKFVLYRPNPKIDKEKRIKLVK